MLRLEEAAAGSFIAARLGFAELRAAAAILDVRAVVGARERFPGEARRHPVAERSAIADPFQVREKNSTLHTGGGGPIGQLKKQGRMLGWAIVRVGRKRNGLDWALRGSLAGFG